MQSDSVTGPLQVSVERIVEYSSLKPEEKQGGDRSRQLAVAPAASWPSAGRIEFRNLVLRYRPGLPAALKGLTCTINPGENVGVCGRTGATRPSPWSLNQSVNISGQSDRVRRSDTSLPQVPVSPA